MVGCCKNKDAQKLEDYFEEEDSCHKSEAKGKCWWSPLFIIDYVIVVILLLMVLVLKKTANPYHMYVPTVNITTAVLDSQGVPHNVVQTIDIDQTRHFPAVKETLPIILAGIIFVVVCAFCWGFSQLFLRCLATRKWNVLHDLHNTALGVFESLSLELFFADVLKPFAGRYRPRYLAIAEQAGSDSHKEWEGRVSYPSGHTGTAFSTMFFCTLYLLGKTRAYSTSSRFGGGSAGRFGAVVFSSFPTLGAFLVGITRTRDYFHNFSDINAGAIIGILSATLAYFTVFPALTDPWCQLPRIRLPGGKAVTEKSKPKKKSVDDDDMNEDDTQLCEVVVNTESEVSRTVSSSTESEMSRNNSSKQE